MLGITASIFCVAMRNAPCVIWLTGLPASGKSTLASHFCQELAKNEIAYEWIDGDAVRNALGESGFSAEDRARHGRSVAWTASLLEKHGICAVVSLISPLRETREFARQITTNFHEIYLCPPLSVCQERDPKGLYRRALSGEISQFTGISAPYDPPTAPELSLNTSKLSVEECTKALLQATFELDRTTSEILRVSDGKRHGLKP